MTGKGFPAALKGGATSKKMAGVKPAATHRAGAAVHGEGFTVNQGGLPSTGSPDLPFTVNRETGAGSGQVLL